MVAPLSQMPGDLRRRVGKIERAIETHESEMLRAGAMAAKGEHLDVMRRDAGGDLRLSRVRSGKGAKIGVNFTLMPHEAIVKATGPLPLLANEIKPHAIPKRGVRGRQRKVLAVPGLGVFAAVNHPGTKGKDTLNRGRAKALPKIKVAIGKRSDQVVKRAFLSGG